MIFLGRDRNLLHAAAEWLLDPANVPEAPDLSRVLPVVRGRRTARRLLELLALRAEAAGCLLIPPPILTPAALVLHLTETTVDEPEAAAPLASALAWVQALQQTPPEERDRLFRLPPGGDLHLALRPLLGLARQLTSLWSEVGGAGLRFRDVAVTVAERFPDVAEFEVPRWETLDALHSRASAVLRQRGLEDHTDKLLRRAREGKILGDRHVVLIGVVEMPGLVREFLQRLPEAPTILLSAEANERKGFDQLGAVRADYWNEHAAKMEPGQLHLVERDRDQAARVGAVVQGWREAGITPGQITVAVPAAESLPHLRESLELRGIATRRAQGRPVSQSPSFQVLQAVAAYLDRQEGEPPPFEAVAALARHPDAPRIEAGEWAALDRYGARHLPVRFDPSDVQPALPGIARIAETLERWIGQGPGELPPQVVAEWTRTFLQQVYGAQEENALSPDGRVAVHALTLLRDVLDATADNKLPWPDGVRPADFLHSLLQFLGPEPVPEPPDRNAVELVGWLELMEDDAPAVVVASFHEGTVPESILADAFLPGSLRQALRLGDNEARMARDGCALAAILAARAQGRGRVALVAPRFDPEGNPVRPSRLLLNGLTGEALAQRVWHAAGKRASEPQPRLRDGPGLGAAPVENEMRVSSISVTAFRDYLTSPRQFYFLHVIHGRAEGAPALELDEGAIGGMMHQVLSRFGGEGPLRESGGAQDIAAFVREEFDRLVEARFGRWAQPAVDIQVEEMRRRLRGFAPVQARLRREGWSIRHVEGADRLQCGIAAADGAGTLAVTGKVDRIDCDASGERWRIIDYKTSRKPRSPRSAHLGRQGWHDLQLPLYLKLVAPFALEKWGVELTPENCELLYFQLPEDEKRAALSEPFPAGLLEEAWARAAEVARDILRGDFERNPPVNENRSEPALLALCGHIGLSLAGAGALRDETGEA